MAFVKHNFVKQHVLLAAELNELEDGVVDIEQSLSELPTEETADELLNKASASRVLTEQVLEVIGYWLTDGLPTDEIGQEIVYRLNEQQRLLDELFTELTKERG